VEKTWVGRGFMLGCSARSMRIKVKICGLTRAADAQAAVAAGADALGFVFYERSSRFLRASEAAAIIVGLPPFVSRVGVFVDAPESLLRETAAICGLDTLQLHGDESPEFCRQFQPWNVIKAFRMQNRAALSRLPEYRGLAWLLDSYVPGQLGGSGARFDWDQAVEASKLGGRIILAGGLTPENVAEAVRRVQPYAVDVSSGVESAPGRKDPHKIRDFIQAAQG
jgi:phosphoribosylanthranilate isomerase